MGRRARPSTSPRLIPEMKENESSDLSIWTIYEKPRDYPQSYVARRWITQPGGLMIATTDVLIAPSLGMVRRLLPPGLSLFSRQPGDEPCIVETWL